MPAIERGKLIVVVVGVLAAGAGGHAIVGSAAAQTPQARAAATPAFHLDASWPKIPAKWKLGNVSSVAVDGNDHVWVLHRPLSLPAAEQAMAAPPVLEFDAAGNFVQAWGGHADGYDWPEREHGIYVDSKQRVWIGGNNYAARNLPGLKPVSDDQLLVFTKAGKLVVQIGKSDQSLGNADIHNFHQPADIVEYPKTNEMFVADGYGNHRVIVLEASTGAFKRMWGGFGNKPVDTPPRGAQILAPKVANDGSKGPQPFDIVHAVRVSNDGLVYVADRENKRVQVFTVEGTFVKQAFIRRDETSEDRTTSSMALSPDPQQQFLYLGGIGANPQVVILNRQTLAVLGSFGKAEGFAGAHHMAIDSKGNLYMANGNAPRKFTLARR